MPRPSSCQCGACDRCTYNARMREYYRANADRIREISRRSRLRRLDKVRAYDRARGYREYDQAKARARRAVSHAVAAGRLARRPCEVCGTTDNVDAHHDDYSRPLDVRWLCRPHHLMLHRTVA